MIYTYGGSITVIVGPMCGGKTTRLISEMRKNKIAGRRILLIKHPSDNRYGDGDAVTTHDMTSEDGFKARNPERLFSCGLSLEEIQKSFDVVCIDEGQFYTDVDEFCESLANLGLRVYVSALLATFRREPFYNVARLMALAETIIQSKAIDKYNGLEASFTMKKNSRGSPVIEVGGLSVYDAVSRQSYFSLQ
jgi:thymidine kinase